MKKTSYHRYILELSLAISAYAAMLVGSIHLLRGGAPSGMWRAFLALSPMLPCLLLIWVVLRQLRRMDELERRVQLEALVFSFVATAFLSFGYGFLEGLDYPKLSLFVVLPTMSGLWIVGSLFAAWRYR